MKESSRHYEKNHIVTVLKGAFLEIKNVSLVKNKTVP
jgi:hypothetical protein